jgi:DNA-binding MarR family transcriptional regulator
VSNQDLNCARELLLQPTEKALLMQLANISKPGKPVFVTIETLVQWSSYSHATVLRALNGLEKLGLIVRRRGARGRATGYTLTLPDYEKSRQARLARQKGWDHSEPMTMGGGGAQRDTNRLAVNQQGFPTETKKGSHGSSLPDSPVFITGSSPSDPATTRERLNTILGALQVGPVADCPDD